MLVYAAGCVQIVRHLLWPTPSIVFRLRRAHELMLARPNLAAAARAFVATRPAVFVVAFMAVITLGLPAAPGFVLSRDPLANLPARYDAGWYGDVALDGYTWDHTFQRQRNIAFFPALPMMMRPVGLAFGMYDRTVPRERRLLRALWAGVVISLAAFFWALYYVTRLATDLIGPERAAGASLLLAAYPFAVFFNAPYTESLFLLGAVAACDHFRRRQWIAASCWGLLVGLTRPNGCLVSIPLAVMAAEPWLTQRAGGVTELRRDAKALAIRLTTAAMPGIGMLLFTAYLYQLTGVWFAWARSHEAWGRAYHGIAPVVALFGQLRDEPFLQIVTNNPYNTLNAVGVVFGVALIYPVFRRLGLAWGVFVLVNLLPPLFAGGLLSMGRLSATLFPLFVALAAILSVRTIPAWAAVFGIAPGSLHHAVLHVARSVTECGEAAMGRRQAVTVPAPSKREPVTTARSIIRSVHAAPPFAACHRRFRIPVRVDRLHGAVARATVRLATGAVSRRCVARHRARQAG